MSSTAITVRLVQDENLSLLKRKIDPYLGQDYMTLLQECLQKNDLFRDPHFPAEPSSLGFNELGPERLAERNIEWKRPQEIFSIPKFIDDDMTWTDICQGALGNCWFLAAAASLTLYPLLLQRVVPPQQKEYAGIFHFQFWQYGQWVDVVVDDRLPTENGELLFVSSAQKSEFWPALLEKAYAKLNGSYEAIKGGCINEAFLDFTGGVGEGFDLKAAPPNLFEIIQKAVEKRSLMGASIYNFDQSGKEGNTPEGLVTGHAYSIIGVSQIQFNGQRILLLRLRNPWGKDEWNQRWSDKSPLWSLVDNATRQELLLNKEDGAFWMQLEDFLLHFHYLEICNLTPDLVSSDETNLWNTNLFQGRWVRGHNAGGCRNNKDTFWSNPKFLVTLEGDGSKPCTMLVSLLQRDRRKERAVNKDFLTIGFEIYKVPPEFIGMNRMSERSLAISNLQPMFLSKYLSKRSVTGHYELTPGHYVIIPTTFHPQEESSFTLRVFTETQHLFKEIDCTVKAEAKVFQVSELPFDQEEFRKKFMLISGEDQEISPEKLQTILVQTTSNCPQLKSDGFSMDTCMQLLKIGDHNGNGKLQLDEFYRLWSKITEWRLIYTEHDFDKSGTMDVQELRLALEAVGFQLNNKLVELLCMNYGDDKRRVDFDSFLSCLAHLMGVFDKCRKMDQYGNGIVTLLEQQWLQMTSLQ